MPDLLGPKRKEKKVMDFKRKSQEWRMMGKAWGMGKKMSGNRCGFWVGYVGEK